MAETSAHISENTQSSGHSKKAPETVFFQPKLTINEPGDQYEREADSVADKVMRMPANNHDGYFFKPASINSIQRKENKSESGNLDKDTPSEDKGGNRSKYSEKEIKAAKLELERSQLFKDLETNPQVDSLSKREYYKKNIERIEEEIKLEAGGDSSKLKAAEQTVLKFELEFSTFKADNSNELRIISFEEWGGGIAEAKAFDDQNRIELRGKNKKDKSSLKHTLAHEYSHLFDPEMNDESVALSEFKDSRTELFAEIFSQLILCEVSGATNCNMTLLKYGSEEKELNEEMTSLIDTIFRSDVTSKEKTEEINTLVKQLTNINSETEEPQIP